MSTPTITITVERLHQLNGRGKCRIYFADEVREVITSPAPRECYYVQFTASGGVATMPFDREVELVVEREGRKVIGSRRCFRNHNGAVIQGKVESEFVVDGKLCYAIRPKGATALGVHVVDATATFASIADLSIGG